MIILMQITRLSSWRGGWSTESHCMLSDGSYCPPCGGYLLTNRSQINKIIGLTATDYSFSTHSMLHEKTASILCYFRDSSFTHIKVSGFLHCYLFLLHLMLFGCWLWCRLPCQLQYLFSVSNSMYSWETCCARPIPCIISILFSY